MANKLIVSKKRAAEKPHKAKAAQKPLKSPAPGQLLIEIDGKAKSLPPKDLRDADKFAELQGQCNGATNLIFHLQHLLDFTGEERFGVLDFIASLNVRPKIVVKDGEEPCEDLLAAVLDVMPDTGDTEKCVKAKMAALEVAALLYADAPEIACDRVVQTMRQRGLKGVHIDNLVRDARRIADSISRSRVQAAEPQAPRLVKEVLPEAPVPAETKIPADWDLTEAGVRSLCLRVVGDISCPLVIAGRGQDNAKGIQYACLAWFREGVWHRRIVDREVLANAQKILALAAFGLPVNSNNARLMVQYFADFEAANIEMLPVASVSRKLGFQGHDGDKGFLWGRMLITADDFLEGSDLDLLAPDEWSKRPVHFQGADEGDDQIAAGFHAAGSFEGWLKAMRTVASYPKVRFAFYAALTVPLLAILRTVNFILDYAGETTSGKTVTLRVAACFAAISTAAFIAHKALDLPWAYSDPVSPLWNELVKEAKDRAAVALQYVMAWAYGHRAEFVGRRGRDLLPPTQGWAGKWDIKASGDDTATWTEVAFLPLRIDAVLREGGYEPHSVIRVWKERGWLHTEKEKDGTVRTERRTRLGEDSPRMVVITNAAVNAAEKATW